MSRYIYLSMFVVYLAFMSASCGTGNQNETHQPDAEELSHDHEIEHIEQEEFTVDTTIAEEHHDYSHDRGDDDSH